MDTCCPVIGCRRTQSLPRQYNTNTVARWVGRLLQKFLSVPMSASRVLSDIIFHMCRIFTNKESNCENCLHLLDITSKLLILRRDIYVQIQCGVTDYLLICLRS